MKEDCYLRKAFNEELANKESGWVTKMRHLLDSYGMSNLIMNIFKVLNDEIDNKHEVFQKQMTVASKHSFTPIKMKRTAFFTNKRTL